MVALSVFATKNTLPHITFTTVHFYLTIQKCTILCLLHLVEENTTEMIDVVAAVEEEEEGKLLIQNHS